MEIRLYLLLLFIPPVGPFAVASSEWNCYSTGAKVRQRSESKLKKATRERARKITSEAWRWKDGGWVDEERFRADVEEGESRKKNMRLGFVLTLLEKTWTNLHTYTLDLDTLRAQSNKSVHQLYPSPFPPTKSWSHVGVMNCIIRRHCL